VQNSARQWRSTVLVLGALFAVAGLSLWWASGWTAFGWTVWASLTVLGFVCLAVAILVRPPDLLEAPVHYVDLRRYSGDRAQAMCECGWSSRVRREAARAEEDGVTHLAAARARAAGTGGGSGVPSNPP